MNLEIFDLIITWGSSSYYVQTFYFIALDLLLPFTTFAILPELFLSCSNETTSTVHLRHYFSSFRAISFKRLYSLHRYVLPISFI